MILWLCVLVRIVSNPVSNALQKVLTQRGLHPLMIVGSTHLLLSLACVPICVQSAEDLSMSFWWSISVCAALAVTSNALLVQAVKLSDLSILGPINAWKAVVSLLPGVVLLGEVPSVAALCGIGLILVGSYVLTGRSRGGGGGRPARLYADRGVQFRFAALVLSGVEAVFLKESLLESTPMITFAWWSVMGLAAAFLGSGIVAQSDSRFEQFPVLRRSIGLTLVVAITTGLMQFTTLVVLSDYAVGPALALFQTSALVSVLLGWRYFQERDVVRRLAGSVVMVVGAILIVLAR
ncbi:MAG: EamA family transporter [Planctomycetaceae bacterium]|nr:EamA family transporter [Planctomycetaceae bacterium]